MERAVGDGQFDGLRDDEAWRLALGKETSDEEAMEMATRWGMAMGDSDDDDDDDVQADEATSPDNHSSHDSSGKMPAIDTTLRERMAIFIETYEALNRASGKKRGLFPTFGGQKLDMYALFSEVTKGGGLESVKNWTDVYRAMNVGPPPTNAAFIMKKHYGNLLQPFATNLAPLVAENAGGNEDVANEKDTVTAKNEEDSAEDEADADADDGDDDDADDKDYEDEDEDDDEDEDYEDEKPVARRKSGVAAAVDAVVLTVNVAGALQKVEALQRQLIVASQELEAAKKAEVAKEAAEVLAAANAAAAAEAEAVAMAAAAAEIAAAKLAAACVNLAAATVEHAKRKRRLDKCGSAVVATKKLKLQAEKVQLKLTRSLVEQAAALQTASTEEFAAAQARDEAETEVKRMQGL
jgi:hypothetical protein